MAQTARGPFVVACGRADLRDHGAADGGSWWRAGGCLVFRDGCVAAWRDGSDVYADERLPFGALAEANLQMAKRNLKKISGACRLSPLPIVLKPRRAETEIL